MATKRRGNGEGSIFQRADGRWVAKIANGYDVNGRRRRRTVYGKTKREVQDKLLELKQQQKLGTLADAKSVTVAQYLARWLEDSARVTLRPTSLERYTRLVNLHITPHIGGIKLDRLRPSDVQALYTELEKKDLSPRSKKKRSLSPRTRQFVHAVLRKAINQACKWGLVQRNVCSLVTPPKVQRKECATLTPVEAVRFLAESESDRLHAMYVLAVTTGMRQGELFGLKWSDVDLEAGKLSVRRTTITVNNRVEIGDTKTARSRRLIKLTAHATEALWEHKAKMLSEGLASIEWVFCDAKGGLLRISNVRRRSFLPILKRGDLPTVRFHDLRHTAATLMLANGEHPKVVQEQLGHAQVTTTMDTYSHVLPSMQAEAANRMDQVLKTAKQKVSSNAG